MPVLPKDCLPSRSVIGETSYDNIPFPFATGVGHLQATAPCISLDSRHLAVEHPPVFEVSACLPRSYIRLRGVCAIFLCTDSERKLLCRGVPHESQKNSFVSSHSFACRLFPLLLQRQQNAVHQQLHWRQRYRQLYSRRRHPASESVYPFVQSHRCRNYSHSHQRYGADLYSQPVDRRRP